MAAAAEAFGADMFRRREFLAACPKETRAYLSKVTNPLHPSQLVRPFNPFQAKQPSLPRSAAVHDE
jgi:hypothetical protein